MLLKLLENITLRRQFCYRVDLHLDAMAQAGLYCGTRRLYVLKIGRIHSVVSVEKGYITKMYGAFHNIVQCTSCCFADPFDIMDRKMCFLFNLTKNKFTRGEVDRTLSANIQPTVNCNTCWICTCTEIFVCLIRMDNLSFTHVWIFWSIYIYVNCAEPKKSRRWKSGCGASILFHTTKCGSGRSSPHL